MDDPRNPEKAPEKAIDGLLSHSLRRALDPAGPACPDAEILAAYCEHSLSRPETSRWEAHFATCSRCQAQLAGVVRSAEAGAVVGRGVVSGRATNWGWLWSWRGLVPVASAAVVVLALWVVDPASLVDRSPSQETAFGEPDLVAPAASAPEAPEAEELAPSAEAVPAQPELAARLELDQATRETFAAEPGTRARRPQQANQAASSPQTAPDRDAQDVQSQPSPQPLERALREPSAAAAARAARADDQLPDSPAPADALQASRAAAVSENRAVQFGVAGGAAGAVVKERLADATIASPAPSILWRLGTSGRIERSTDGGQSWTLQADIGVELLAGSASSELVCWVVGRGGMVMRTTDGERWNQAAAPTDQDLVSIDAQDAMNATTRAADGSRFVTTDGGRTWTLGAR